MVNLDKNGIFYPSDKINIDLYNSASEWIDFKEGAEIFSIRYDALASRVKKANLLIEIKKIKGDFKKYYFRKLDFIKLFFLDENEAVERFNMPLKILKEWANEGIIDTIEIDKIIYYNCRFQNKYTAIELWVKQHNAITIEEAYKFRCGGFDSYDDFVLYVFENRDKFYLKYINKLNTWFVSNLIAGKKFYSSDKIDMNLYNSANEWIDFREGAVIFGVNYDALASRVKKANLTIQSKNVNGKVQKYYFRKLDYIKLFFLDENEAVERFNIPLKILKKWKDAGSINTIEIDGYIYYYYQFNEEFDLKYSATKTSMKHNNAITIEEAYKFHYDNFNNYDDFVLYVFENRDKFYLKYVYKLNTWFVSNSIIGKKISSLHMINVGLYNSASEWIDFKEGEEIFGLKSSALNSKVKRHDIPIKVVNVNGKVQKYYFRKLDYIKLFFIDENEAVKRFNMPLKILKEWANEGIIDNIEIDGVIYYYHKFQSEYNSKYSVSESWVKQNNAIRIEDAYKFRCNEFGSYDDFVLYVFKNRDKFYLKYIYKLNTWFVSNSIIGIVKKRPRSSGIEHRMYHKKIEEAYSYVNKLFDSYEDFKNEIMKNKNKYNIKFIERECYVDLSKIFFSPRDAAKELNMNYRILLKWVQEGFFEKIQLSDTRYLITSIKDKNYKNYLEFKANKNNTLPTLPREMFESDSHMIDYYLKWINERTNFKDSLRWIGYSIHKFSEKSQATRSKFETLKKYLYAAFRLVQNLEKEVYDYNNEEINKLYKRTLKCQDDILNMNTFLDYIMHNKLDCNYSDLPREYRKKKKDKGLNDRFSPEIVERYFYYLSDLDKHFLKAVHDYRYAQLWLISMLHLSLPRRIGNMIDLPKPDIELVDIYSFNDLFDRDITMNDMQVIIDNIKAKSYGEVASKNGWDLAFVRDLDLITQTGIAFTICELHRRAKGEKVLNFSFKNNNPRGEDWKKFFDDEFLKGFGNLKAVRSFLVDIYKYTSNVPDLRALSYSIITKFRAHKTNGIDESEVTKEYLEITKVDGFQDKIIYNVQRIGAFGFLYNLLVNLAYDTSQSSLEDQISYLENLKEDLSKKSIEDLSSFLSEPTKKLNGISKKIISLSKKANVLLENKFMEDMKCYNEYRISEQIALAKEVIKLSKEEIRNKLEDIFKNLLDSKQPYCYCFKGFKNCKKRSSSSSVCIICKYSIPTIYALSSLKKDLNNLFEKIKTTPLDNRQMLFKYKILLLKYIGVISEIYNEFAKYDKEFINSFINISEVKKQVVEIEKSVFNKAGGLR